MCYGCQQVLADLQDYHEGARITAAEYQVPPEWQRYYDHMSGQPDRSQAAHLMMPTELVHHYREYDRDPADPNYQVLKKVIREHGNQIRQPLVINADDTHGVLTEGNHRAAIARELGITHLPVRVQYGPKAQANEGTPVPHHPAFKQWLDANMGTLRTAGANGDLPELRYEYSMGPKTKRHRLMAYDDTLRVGWLDWTPGGEVENIEIHPDYQRRGIASEMWRRAQDIDPYISHSRAQTSEGKAWAAAVGGRTASFHEGARIAAAETPFIARGMSIGLPDDDHDLFHAINEHRATPEHMYRLLTHTDGRAGVWWGTYRDDEHPDPKAYGSFEDFVAHAGMGEESVAKYHDSGEYHDRVRAEGGQGPGQIFAEVPVVAVGTRPKRGDELWDPDKHNPADSLMGNSYLDDNEPIDLHEVHYNSGRGWVKVPMKGYRVQAVRTAGAYDPYVPIRQDDQFGQFYAPTQTDDQGRIRVHRGLIVPHGTHPDHVADGGVGPHWSVNSQISESFADPDYYGEGDDDIGMVLSGWLDPTHDTNMDSDDLTGGSGYHNEQELTLHPGTPVHVDRVRWRPTNHDGHSWNEHPWTPRTVTAFYQADDSLMEPDPAPFGVPRRYASIPDGYNIHLVTTNGYGGGTVAAYPKTVRKPGPNNWHAGLQWDNYGKITHVDTKEPYRGKGLARALYEHVKQNYRPDLMHDSAISADGKAFADAVGGQMFDADEYQRRRDQHDQERKLPYEQRSQMWKERGWPSFGVLD
ncbi:hypothetical protein BI081_gp097 [Mycobacterium phage Tonenili]|uniref:ParB-like nuclease domain protein n=1 Tax=Mycobacterium phage Tonenili TaxID=1891703 RepID=A0A1C9EH76_9CAUD|nr:hypothetical protein BI081_gp097 [Mycobacterium phage Tonenili]AON96848.1 hypothetical protein SEA_TONENILI_97 [Mycobacterium phage Tonenili]